jgi:ribosomal protein S18 acetylase RimI-like enzyme
MADDPLQRYLFPPAAAEAERTLFRLIAAYGIRQGNLLATSRKLEGVAYWQTPQDRTWVGAAPVLREGLRLLAQSGAGGVARLVRASAYTFRRHRRHAPFPHWYLALLAVRPRHQGRGFAGLLLKPVLARLQRERHPCYLETNTPQNVSLYRHFGFRVVEESVIPDTPVRLWCLIKK